MAATERSSPDAGLIQAKDSSGREAGRTAGILHRSEFGLGDAPATRPSEAMERKLGILVLMVDADRDISGAACRLPELDAVLQVTSSALRWRLVALGELKPAAARALPTAALRHNGRAGRGASRRVLQAVQGGDGIGHRSGPCLGAAHGRPAGCDRRRARGRVRVARLPTAGGNISVMARPRRPRTGRYQHHPGVLPGHLMVLRSATRTGLVIATMALNTTRRARSWLSWEGATRCHRRADSVGRRVRRLCDSAVAGL